MIADDISNWILTLPKWQQKLSYLIMEKKHISEEELKCTKSNEGINSKDRNK